MTEMLERAPVTPHKYKHRTAQEMIGATTNFHDAEIIYRERFPTESLIADMTDFQGDKTDHQDAFNAFIMLVDRYKKNLDPEEQAFINSEAALLAHVLATSKDRRGTLVTIPSLYKIVTLIDLLQEQSPDLAEQATHDLELGIKAFSDASPLKEEMGGILEDAFKQYRATGNLQPLGRILAKLESDDLAVTQTIFHLYLALKDGYDIEVSDPELESDPRLKALLIRLAEYAEEDAKKKSEEKQKKRARGFMRAIGR